MLKIQLKKLIHLYRNYGFVNTVKETIKFVRRNIKKSVNGLPGHYCARYQLLKRDYKPSEITPIWVSPSNISYLTGEYTQLERGHLDYSPYFKPQNRGSTLMSYQNELSYGTTVSGRWDQYREPFAKLLMYQGIQQHYLEGIPWTETVYYDRLVARFCEQGMGANSAKVLARKRCNHIDSIYNTIKNNGYRPQKELDGHPLNEVTVNIARDGTLLYNSEGRHRLSIAKVLGIDEIPVLILAEHAEYEGDLLSNRQ